MNKWVRFISNKIRYYSLVIGVKNGRFKRQPFSINLNALKLLFRWLLTPTLRIIKRPKFCLMGFGIGVFLYKLLIVKILL